MREMSVIRYAMVKDGVVQNISLWDGDTTKWQPPQDVITIPAPDDIGVGWNYVHGVWTDPKTQPEE